MNVGMSVTPSGMARGVVLGIEDDTMWIKDLYKLQWDHQRVDNLFLVLQIMEYNNVRSYSSVHEQSTEYNPIAYAVIKVNNPDATIRYGTLEADLYKPPINLLQQHPMDKLKSSIKITIGQPMSTRRSVPIKPPSQKQAQLPMEPEEQPRQMTPSYQESQPDTQDDEERPFIPNQQR